MHLEIFRILPISGLFNLYKIWCQMFLYKVNILLQLTQTICIWRLEAFAYDFFYLSLSVQFIA
jgi:hypothetical protein